MPRGSPPERQPPNSHETTAVSGPGWTGPSWRRGAARDHRAAHFPGRPTAMARRRPWAFAELNADPEVMEHFPRALNESRQRCLRRPHYGRHDRAGLGPSAVEITTTGGFAGFVGLNPGRPSTHRSPLPSNSGGAWAVRTGARHCHRGRPAPTLSYGFGTLGLDEVVSFTSTTNLRSQRASWKARHAPQPRR